MMAPTTLRNRDGFALLVALLAIVITTALTLATLLRTDQNAQVARVETLTQRAFAGAETALWEAVASTDIRQLRAEWPGTVAVSEIDHGDLATNVIVTKIDTATIWIVADAVVRKGRDQAHHKLGLSATIMTDTMDTRLYPVSYRGWVDLF